MWIRFSWNYFLNKKKIFLNKYSTKKKQRFYYKVNNEQDPLMIPNNNHIMHEIYQEYEQDHHEELN